MNHKESVQRHEKMYKQMRDGGGAKRREAQHAKGKLAARERLDLLLDEGSFIEQQPYAVSRSTDFGMESKRFLGDGVVTGTGKIDGRQVCLFAQDFTVLGGSLGEMHAERIADAQRLALKTGVPFIQINDSGGARIQEGIHSLEGYGKIFHNNTRASGVIPQISVILGPCAGGAVYSPAITDFVFMVDGVSNMYITGPEVIKAVTGEQIDHEGLGGAAVHTGTSGNAHFKFSSEQECLEFLPKFLSYLPMNNMEDPPWVETDDPVDRSTEELSDLLPADGKRPYDMRDVAEMVCDEGSFIEIQSDYAQNQIIGLARLGGRTVGVFGSQPFFNAGTLDIDSSDKVARFIRFCDSFNIPLISLVDVPGYLPGVGQEHGGVIRHGAKILYAIAEATVPKISLIVRKAYGGAYIAMSSKALGYDRVLALPTAEIAVMGAEGAANIIFRQEINEAEDPEKKRAEKIEEYQKGVMNPFIAAGYGLIDEVVGFANVRRELVRSVEMLIRKHDTLPWKKHGNIPL